MTNRQRRVPSVLISWAHRGPGWSADQISAHRDAVLDLASSLRRNGIDADLDLFHLSEAVDWTRWGPQRIDECDFVLVVVSEAWRLAWEGRGDPRSGAGAAAEADALQSIFAVDRGAFINKVRLVLLPGCPRQEIPSRLHGVARFQLANIDDDALTDLLRSLTEQPEFVKGELGDLPELPPRPSQVIGAQPRSDTPNPDSTKARPEQGAETSPERRNALAKAHEYLRVTAFSSQGLADQLTISEGFSEEDSKIAVENVGADWNEQAAKKADAYLQQMAFSRTGLIGQLISEGFSSAESEHAAAAAEDLVDWRQQAARKAHEYLALTSFSRQGLKNQLIFDGFAEVDAEAGAAAAL